MLSLNEYYMIRLLILKGETETTKAFRQMVGSWESSQHISIVIHAKEKVAQHTNGGSKSGCIIPIGGIM